MSNFYQFINKIKTLSSTLENYHYIYNSDNLTESEINDLKQLNCAIKTSVAENILSASIKGVSRDDLYYVVDSQSDEELRSVFGKCRYIISNFNQLERINSISKELVKKGFLESIAISFSLDNSSIFCKESIHKLSSTLKNLDSIAVRGLFFTCNAETSEDYITYMKSAYDTTKEITCILPCKITFLSLGSCIDILSEASIEQSDSNLQFIKNANLVSFLNTTSFYSRLLIS